MYIYQLTYACPERGLLTRYERNAAHVKATKRYWAKRYPLRELVIEERIDVPDTKDALIDFLNEHIGETDGRATGEKIRKEAQEQKGGGNAKAGAVTARGGARAGRTKSSR